MRRVSLVGVVLGALALAPTEAKAVFIDPDASQTAFATGLGAVTSFAWAPDGSQRLFVTIKTGEVRIVEDGQLLPDAFVTISPIEVASECGLLGITFDPDFISNGYVYLFVTVTPDEQRIVRYTARGNAGEAQKVIVSGIPTRGANHDGGSLEFGPDGKLYFAVGDNGAAVGVGDDVRSLAAKLSRVNADGSAPRDNPFFDGDGPNNDLIWARGFRNPFTLTFQPSNGRLWLNVVGTLYEQVFTPHAGDNGGWNAYESNQPPGYLLPIISYKTKAIESHLLGANGAVRIGGITTLYTSEAHRYRSGAKLTLAGLADASFNGNVYVRETLSTTQLSFEQAGPDAISGGGSVSSQDIGGCVTGGTFWESNAAPVDYQGSFFFGDYVSGRMMRATLTPEGAVTKVDEWANTLGRPVDTNIGPDGNFYYALGTGSVFRVSYPASAQGIIVSARNLRLQEGGHAAFNVRLAAATTTARSVAVGSTNTDVGITAGKSLLFNASNWSVPQPVVLEAAEDDDSAEDSAVIRLVSSGLTSQSVTARVTDDESYTFVVTPSPLMLDEGASADLAVALSQPPAATITVSVSRRSGDADVSVTSGASLSFTTRNWATPQTVTISAAEDADSDNDSATLVFAGNGPSPLDLPVTVIDANGDAPAFTSEPVVLAAPGLLYAYDADASGAPAPHFSLDQAPPGMTIDPLTGVVAWRPSSEGLEPVTVRASNGVAPDATQAFDVEVSANVPPSGSAGEPSQPSGGAPNGGAPGETSVGGEAASEPNAGGAAEGGASSADRAGAAGSGTEDDAGGGGSEDAPASASDDVGCSCSLPGQPRGASGGLSLAVALCLLGRARLRRRMNR